MARRDQIVLNDYKSHRGKGVSTTVKADRIVHNLDPVALGKGPADALKDAVATAIRAITDLPKASTLARRARAGVTSRKLFQVTGKLVRGLTVKNVQGTFETHAPADRLQTSAAMNERLFEVAKLSGAELMADSKVKAAVQKSVGTMVEIKKGRR